MIQKILAITIFSSLMMISCNNGNESTKKDVTEKTEAVADSVIIKKGKSIAMGTFKVLGGKLKAAIKSGGPVAGIDICSSEASKLTDSLSTVYNVTIKRTSLKYRNDNNAPKNSEKEILENWQKNIDAGNIIKPNIIRNKNNEITFVAPIKIKHQCIVCHGSDDYVSSDVRLKLKKHYPNDKARNYSEGDLRGAWVITFPKDYFSK